MTLLDVVYFGAAGFGWPWWLLPRRRRERMLAAGKAPAPRRGTRPAVWFHGVSVGEVIACRPLVAGFRARRPDWDVVVSSTTDTGLEVARRGFVAPDRVVRFPLDFSWIVDRALARLRPDLLVLMELEIWPNFLAAARRRGVPVAIVNGRMTDRARDRYRFAGGLLRGAWRDLAFCAAQDEASASRFREVGVSPERVVVTGNLKWDGLPRSDTVEAPGDLVRLRSTAAGPVFLAASTHFPEDRIALEAFGRLRAAAPAARLALAPRHPHRAEAVERDVAARGLRVLRRGAVVAGSRWDPDVVLIEDRVGELAALYALADHVFVGGSLIPHGGQNVMEPAALGKPVVIGPHTQNFAEAVGRLEACGAAERVRDADSLAAAWIALARDPEGARQRGRRAEKEAMALRGATERTLDLLIPNPKSQIPNPKSQIVNPKSQIPNSKSQIPNPKFQIPNSKFQNANPKFQIPNPKFQIPKPKSQILNPKSQIPRATRAKG